jgi:hypothetical protein
VASSPLPFLADGEGHHDLQQQKHTQQLILLVFLDLIPRVGFVFFSVSGGDKTKGAADC